ncbi:hypothetical protein Tco_0482293 [Tanacetum coccineum]
MEVIPFFNLLKEHFEELQRSLVKEVRAMKAVFKNMEAEVDQNAIDKKSVFYTVTDSALNASQFHDLSVAYNVAKTRTVELEAENSKLRDKIQNDDHDNMVKHFSKLEIDNLNLQLKYQHLKECIDTSNSKTSKDAPEFDAVFKLNKKDDQLQAHRNTIRKLKAQISQLKANKSDVIGTHEPTSLDSQHLKFQDTVTKLQEQNDIFQAENTKVKLHYQELFDSIKVTRVKHIEKITSLLNEIENLKTQVKGKTCVTNNVVTPKVSAIAKYAIEVESISASLKNHKNIHHHYLNLLKDILDTLCEIVEEDRIAKPLDNVVAHACTYTKRSQELLEYVIGTCLKVFNKRDKYIATISSTRKKHVTFAEPLETSNHSTSKPIQHPDVKKSNVPISLSTKVNSDTKASRSKPRSNIKNDRTLTAKSVPKKKVENHIRNTKSDLHKQNRVDSSISLKRTVINSISDSRCKTCTKCIISSNHDKCVEKFLNSSNKPLVKKVWRVKQVKQTWKATGKLTTKPKVVHVRQWKPTGRIIPLVEQCLVTRSIASTSAGRIDRPVIFGLRLFTTYKGKSNDVWTPTAIGDLALQTLHFFQASDLNVNKMASADNTSGPALQRKERCTLQCALSLEEEKSSCLRPFSSTSFMLFHACSIIKWINFRACAELWHLASFSIKEDASSTSISSSSVQQSPSVHQGVAVDHMLAVNPFAPVDDVPFVNIFALNPSSKATSSGEVSPADPNQSILPHEHLRK